jgi:type IV secretion system protein VirB3
MTMEKHLFHKGCTKPSMVFGMPLVGFVMLFMVWFLLAMFSANYSTPPVTTLWTVLFLAACGWLRAISKRDGYVFSQKVLRLRLRSRNVNRKWWGAVSYSPLKRQRQK